ncbi:MAG: tRNA uridine-5-carboxymethylaminomethyl(34) synthesis GTPase MnmE [Peptococcaceae bacterium]|jgi:tRNA modification GTPase|nr:MAG: tRNA uridine-5-carboxymethylaminomethyl(34) synthesis GTPase MnmE [Peptococcaceae bacterium]
MFTDTISAISTPTGEGGIGIVRMSGSDAVNIARKIFQPKKKREWAVRTGNRLVYGYVFDPESGVMIDEVLLGYMKAPYTYTREDVVEINCHGGIRPLKKVLELTLAAGARLAEPGEFSKRAFLNGRLDLAQAESIIDLVRSRTDAGLCLAVNQLSGRLSREIALLQQELLGLLALIEANIDFPEEDIEKTSRQELLASFRVLLKKVEDLILGAETGRVYREGLGVAIIGKPNVGKSSLLNALLREKRAIVTDIPGTTRDIIEEMLNIQGIPLKIMDTAGLRHTEDVVEKIGVEQTGEAVGRADLVLLVLDVATGITDEDLEAMELIKEKKGIILINKIDLNGKNVSEDKLREKTGGKPVLRISVKEGTGMEDLEKSIVEMVLGGKVISSDAVLVTNVRHKQALEKAKRFLGDAVEGIIRGAPVDLVAIDLRSAWESFGEITGSSVTEDLVNRIFADFCVGK